MSPHAETTRPPAHIPTLCSGELDPQQFAHSTCFEAGYLVSKNAGWRNRRPVVDEAACTGCLQCYLYCPDGTIYKAAASCSTQSSAADGNSRTEVRVASASNTISSTAETLADVQASSDSFTLADTQASSDSSETAGQASVSEGACDVSDCGESLTKRTLVREEGLEPQDGASHVAAASANCGVRQNAAIAIDYDFCKGCGICAKVCKFGAISMVPESEADAQ